MYRFKRILICLTLFVLAVLLPISCLNLGSQQTTTAPESTLNVFNWSSYIAPEVLDLFQKQFNVKIRYDTFDGNDALYAKLKSGNPGYDLVFPSDYMVTRMIKEGMLEPLNLNNIPNLKHLDPKFLNPPYDPGNKHTIAYQWGTQGIGYNIQKTAAALDSWSAMFDSKYKGRIAWVDEMRDTLGVVLVYLGYSPNTTNPDEISQARDLLIKHRDLVAAFAADTGQNLLSQGEIDLALEYSGDIFQAMQENPDLRYSIPREGTVLWVDNMAIPKGAPSKELAEAFINFILDPKIGAQISNFTHYASPNLTARQQGLINETDLKNPELYPSPEIFAKLETIQDVGSALKLYDEAWTAVKVAMGQA